MPTTIAVFGGTGTTGRHFIDQALAAGHHIRALSRRPDTLEESDALKLIVGDVSNEDSVKEVLTNSDVVFVCLGSKGRAEDLGVCEAGTRVIVKQMKDLGITRTVVVTTMGIGDSYDDIPWYFKLFVWLVLSKAFADHEKQEEVLRDASADIQWTVIRPSGLTDNPLVTDKSLLRIGFGIPARRIPRANVAELALSTIMTPLGTGADDKESPAFLHRNVSLTT
eukprot:TRINITY_DN4896_c0_g2_i1.p2 TRINITY_DN4896_c0_g2~~TRINITY_DN4896_c0_g2_i1.p2  ORF type:complete len:223 (+),score=45.49 TRINITY_DN4896_c0_g2_i1:187-855(+)